MPESSVEFYTELKRLSFSMQNFESGNAERAVGILRAQNDIIEILNDIKSDLSNNDIIEILKEIKSDLSHQNNKYDNNQLLTYNNNFQDNISIKKFDSLLSGIIENTREVRGIYFSISDITTIYILSMIAMPFWFIFVVKVLNFFGVHIL